MKKYIVNLYREMRLTYLDIEADTPEAAAALAAERSTEDAENIEDCNGDNLAALVDLVGDDDFSQSVTIDFEAERTRKAAGALLAALRGIIDYAENEAIGLENDDCPEATAWAVQARKAVETARAVIAEATASCPPCVSAEPDIHALLARQRQIAHIWSLEDVQGIRPDLDGDQAWEVLQAVDRHKDAELGITWLTLEMAAEDLFGDAPETNAAPE